MRVLHRVGARGCQRSGVAGAQVAVIGAGTAGSRREVVGMLIVQIARQQQWQDVAAVFQIDAAAREVGQQLGDGELRIEWVSDLQ